MEKMKSLKGRKPIVYISLVIYLLLSTLIIVESCIPGGASGIQSQLFANISAWFVNLIKGDQVPSSIDPISIGEVEDSSILGQDENGYSNIAIGTTSRIIIPINYPEKQDIDVYNYKYSLSYPLGTETDYKLDLRSSISKNTFTLVMRVTTYDMNDDLYQINVNFASLTYEYKFHIVEKAEPTDYTIRTNKNNIKIGETIQVETKIKDDNYYYQRYYDVSKISRSSSNEAVATIDEFGVIHGISAGTSTITFGKYNFDVTVSDEVSYKPVTNELNLNIDPSAKNSLSTLDYDYVFYDKEKYNPNDYSVLVYASFSDDSIEDQSISWEIDNDLMVKMAPYKYDEEGYPIYHDDLNRYCVRLCGYRLEGTINLTAYSNSDPSLSKTIQIVIAEAIPTALDVNVSTNKIYVNEQIILTGTFIPENTNNKNIHVSVSDTEAVSISNNDTTTVTLTGLKVSNVKVTICSVANDTLIKEFDLEITAKKAINEDNYSDFHSFMRKAAGHFFLFLVTAIFGAIFFYTFIDDKKKIWLIIIMTLLSGFFTAGLSELIQLMVPGRGGTFADIGIDFLGYVVGTFICLGIIFLINYIKARKAKVTE